MSKELTFSPKQIENRIFTIRGVHVMIDSSLAEMYGVSTGRLNEQVKRNIERVPDDFMFQLTEKEWQDLMTQNAISNQENSLRSQNAILESGRGKHRKYQPYVFTEQYGASLKDLGKKWFAFSKMNKSFSGWYLKLNFRIDMNIRQDQLPKGWEVKTLGEIADVEYGFTDKSTDEGDYRYVRITDIDNNGELVSTDKKYLKHSKEAEGFLIRDNDLLMARTGATFAKVLLYEDLEPSVFASYLIRINFKEKIENKLYWYFTKTKSYWDQANSLASGAAQPHFNGAAVKQVIFSYPKSSPEQQRIVAILDEAFAAIAKAKANAEQNLKNAKELFESYLQGVFENKGEDWEEKTLGDVM